MKFADEDKEPKAIAIDDTGNQFRLSKTFQKTGTGKRHKPVNEAPSISSNEEIEKKIEKEVNVRTSKRIKENKIKELEDQLKGKSKQSDFIFNYGDRPKRK